MVILMPYKFIIPKKMSKPYMHLVTINVSFLGEIGWGIMVDVIIMCTLLAVSHATVDRLICHGVFEVTQCLVDIR